MNIVYFGSDVFLSCFEHIAENHHILALYTYHNDEDYFTEFSIARRAKELGIPVHYEDVSPDVTRRYFAEGCRLYFVAEYDRLIRIPDDVPGFRGVNIHSSALPEGRSYYPIEGAMERGLKRTGVTMHELKPQLDGGAIVDQRIFDITPDMDSVDVYLTCAAFAREMTEKALSDFDAAWDAAKTQTERLPYWQRPADEKLTLAHEMRLADAADAFRRYNSLTQVRLGDRLYYVSALAAGKTALFAPEIQLAGDRWLYAVRDGHLRLTVHPKNEKGDH